MMVLGVASNSPDPGFFHRSIIEVSNGAWFVEVLGWGINHSKLNFRSCYTNRLPGTKFIDNSGCKDSMVLLAENTKTAVSIRHMYMASGNFVGNFETFS